MAIRIFILCWFVLIACFEASLNGPDVVTEKSEKPTSGETLPGDSNIDSGNESLTFFESIGDFVECFPAVLNILDQNVRDQTAAIFGCKDAEKKFLHSVGISSNKGMIIRASDSVIPLAQLDLSNQSEFDQQIVQSNYLLNMGIYDFVIVLKRDLRKTNSNILKTINELEITLSRLDSPDISAKVLLTSILAGSVTIQDTPTDGILELDQLWNLKEEHLSLLEKNIKEQFPIHSVPLLINTNDHVNPNERVDFSWHKSILQGTTLHIEVSLDNENSWVSLGEPFDNDGVISTFSPNYPGNKIAVRVIGNEGRVIGVLRNINISGNFPEVQLLSENPFDNEKIFLNLDSIVPSHFPIILSIDSYTGESLEQIIVEKPSENIAVNLDSSLAGSAKIAAREEKSGAIVGVSKLFNIRKSISSPTELNSLALWLTADNLVFDNTNTNAENGENVEVWGGVDYSNTQYLFSALHSTARPVFQLSSFLDDEGDTIQISSVVFNGWWGIGAGLQGAFEHRNNRTVISVVKRTVLNSWGTIFDGPTMHSFADTLWSRSNDDPDYQWEKDWYVRIKAFEGSEDMALWEPTLNIGHRGRCPWNSDKECESLKGSIHQLIILNSRSKSDVETILNYIEKKLPGIRMNGLPENIE